MMSSRPFWLATLAVLLLASSLSVTPALSQDEDAVYEEDDYEDEERAFLLVKKAVVEEVVVQGRNFTVKLDLYNAGSNSAKDIKIREPPLPAELELVDGSLSGDIGSIAPGKTASWQYSVVSTSAGHFVSPPCSVTYQAESDEDSVQETVSTIFTAAILSPSQRNWNYALKTGSYLTLGMLNTVSDWRNSFIAVGVVVVLVGLNWSYTKITQTTSERRRQRALEELEGKSD